MRMAGETHIIIRVPDPIILVDPEAIICTNIGLFSIKFT